MPEKVFFQRLYFRDSFVKYKAIIVILLQLLL